MIGKVPAPYKAPVVPAKAPVIPNAPPLPPGALRNVASRSEIGVIAPNLRTVDWPTISGVKKPFANVTSKDFGFWFNYFWAEATDVADLTKAQQVKISEVFLSIFTPETTRDPRTGAVTVNTPATFRVRGDFATRSPEFMENALRQLLVIGFKRVPLAPRTPPKPGKGFQMGGNLMVAQDASVLNFTMVGDPGAKKWPVAFRSDTRTYETLLLHKGFNTRARENEKSQVYTDYAMDQPWHPFNNPVYKNSLFLRIGQTNKDNCLNTVISVGQKLSDITHFPILSDAVLVFTTKSADGRYLALKPLTEWTDGDVQLAAAHNYKIMAVKEGGVVDHLEKRNTIHVFHLDGIKGVNTQQHFGGDAFNERGMAQVPASHLLAEISLTQKYFFDEQREKIAIYEINFDSWRWVPSEQVVDGLLGRNARLQLGALIEGEKQQVTAKYRGELAQYRMDKLTRGTRLTSAEKLELVQVMAPYYRVRTNRISESLEKQFAVAQAPHLTAKINALTGQYWNEYRMLAKRA